MNFNRIFSKLFYRIGMTYFIDSRGYVF